LEAICDLFTTEEYESGAAQKAKKVSLLLGGVLLIFS
jgi:hypothetical protein